MTSTSSSIESAPPVPRSRTEPPPHHAARVPAAATTSGQCPTPWRMPVARVRSRSADGELDVLSKAILAKAGAHGLEIVSAGCASIPAMFEGRAVGKSDWVLTHGFDDPILARKGHLPMPDQVRTQLTALVDAGLDFPTTVIAHEVSGDGSSSAAEIMKAPGVAISRADAHRMVKDPPAHPDSQRTVDRLDKLALGAGTTAKAAAKVVGYGVAGGVALGFALGASPLLLLSNLDPMVLGAVTLPGTPHIPGSLAAWFELGSWAW